MLRGEITQFLEKQNKNIVYFVSSNKNLDIYFNNLNIKNFKIIKIDDVENKEEFLKINYDLLSLFREKNDFIIFISLDGVLKKYFLSDNIFSLGLGEHISRKDIVNFFENNNYEKTYLVEKKLTFSIRGDILDFFPPNTNTPIRLEFFGNEIDRISYFYSHSQKSFQSLSNIDIHFGDSENNFISFVNFLKNLRKNCDFDIFIENIDIIKYKLEEKILENREMENEFREIFLFFEKNAKSISVQKSEKDNILKRNINSTEGIKYRSTSQIKIGDYVIHENYGVGIYLGMEELSGQEYLAIKYADEDKLYVPIENLNKIEKYIITPGVVPELYNLGRRGFKRKKEKLEKDMLEYAKEIIKIQAKRNLNIGYKFSPDTIWQEEFEENFPFNETLDQKKAIADVKRDLESSKVMDRIICGDVGFGKTEVGIRAAFKVIMEGKQVLFIAPTTVLAQQHYDRLVKRFETYPISLGLLSRLTSPKEQMEVLKKLSSGSMDIVIGTHRLLSDDIKFKDLGLVIIDEEQKFGVKAKEKLKTFRTNVDMLTLTATPIPRTLNYALLGIRDISIIETAPEGRTPVQVDFLENNQEKIKKVILKELAREGQVFYIFNSVKKMENKLKELKSFLPAFITIDYIHGQMPPKSIKKILTSFENGNIDILLSSTIIENGIDIENANTIIIEGMENMGLSQIYQLKGRVGRGYKKGYCYLLFDNNKKLGKKATLRKDTLSELDDIGSGFNLSLEDMKIRGAGEILGEKQHGVIETFGYNLYIKLLNEEVAKLKGEYTENYTISISLQGNSFIPKDYILEDERLIIYRRLVEITSISQLNDITLEIKDRFGNFPTEVKNLLRGIKIKILGLKNKLLEIKEINENEVFIKFDNKFINFEKILNIINNKKGRYSKIENGIYYYGKIEEFFNNYNEE